MYIPLHGYSTFSFLEAIGKPKDIIKKAKELWFPAIGLTDLNVIYWLIQLYQAANAEWIKPIFWVEVGFVFDVNNVRNVKNVWSICLLATTSQWYLNLLKLVTYASQEGIEYRPKIDFQSLEKNKEWIFCFSWGVDSWIASMIRESEPIEKVEETLDMLISILGKENCYLEMIAQDEKEEADIKSINTTILWLSQKKNIPCIVSNIYQYPSEWDKVTHELAMAIKDNLTIYDPNHRAPKTKNHLMTEDEIRKMCKKNGYEDKFVNEWIDNTQKIADLCDASIEMWQKLFPKYEVEPDILEKYEAHKNELVVED